MKKVVIEIEKLIENIDILLKRAGNAKIIAVLKGNGYGLGIVLFANLLLERGVDFFAVSEIDEAKKLREAGIEQEILILSSTAVEEDIKKIIDLDLTASLGSLQAIDALEHHAKKAGKNINAHIKVDTGFGRFGFIPPASEELISKIKVLEYINITGIYTHLSFSFAKSKKPSQKQFDLFMRFVNSLEEAGIKPKIKHIANSCAFLRWDDFHLDAVRIGSAFTGRLPIKLEAALNRIGTLKANIIEVKTLPKKHNIGYANLISTKRETKIGIVPVGHMDGYAVERQPDMLRIRDIIRTILSALLIKPRYAIANGKKVRLIGRVSMYSIILDITGLDLKVGDEVILPCNPILLDGSIERSYE